MGDSIPNDRNSHKKDADIFSIIKLHVLSYQNNCMTSGVPKQPFCKIN